MRRAILKSIWSSLARAIATACFCFGGPALSEDAPSGSVVVHRGFDDFRQGSFADGGANIYLSRGGDIQLIPQWDLNGDGALDLLFNQDHNMVENVDAFIYWGTEQGYHSLLPAFWKELPAFKLVRALDRSRRHMTLLPTFGGGPVKILDLNHDGHVDLVFPNTIHNYSVHMEAYIYWGGPEGYTPRRRTELPTLFALDVAAGDLNRDGYADLVFANYGNESGDRWGYKNHRNSFIYWGGPDGFSVARRSVIPSRSAVSCAVGDFNGDQWPDLAFANNNLRHKSLYVYLGGKEGFGRERRLEREEGDPVVLRSSDLNQDGIDDLVVCLRGTGSALHFGNRRFTLTKPTILPTQDARDAATADFNGDGHIDLVFASRVNTQPLQGSKEEAATPSTVETESEIYWGDEAGFDPRRRLLLPTLSPRAVVAADLNGDHFPEIVFANEHDGQTFDVSSYIYWGRPEGFDAANRSHLQGFGTVGVGAADLNRDGRRDILLMNQLSGRNGGLPSIIFWGNPAHRYSSAHATRLATDHPYYSRVADLNDDGHPDIVFTGKPVSIYWGSDSGFKRRTRLDIDATGITVGDFNVDGYLDLAFLIWSSDPRDKNYALLVWGSKGGYSKNNSTRIPLKAFRGGTGISSADLNKDGYLELVISCKETPTKVSEIVWGSSEGFGSAPSMLLETNGVAAPAIADLDNNGWLDLVFPGSANLDTQDPHTKTLVYWGSDRGFADDRRTELEAYSALEIGVADLNRDGHLDIVSGNYKAESTRSLPIFIYWGSAQREYSSQHRTALPAESSCGVQVLDLNGDAYPEIIVHNHIKDGDHTFGAYIYWGGRAGYSAQRRTHLPTVGTHFAFGITPGNIYDRRPEHDYDSPVVRVSPGMGHVTLDWKGDTPHKTSIRFAIRAASTEASLLDAPWVPIAGDRTLALPTGAALLQYRAVLASPDGGNTPRLREVRLRLQ